MPFGQSRRSFLSQVALGAAGMSGLATVGFGSGGRSFAAEPPPEVTTVTLEKAPPPFALRRNTSPRTCFGLRGSPISVTERGMRTRLWSWRTIR
jgi:hypothetical protein